MLTAYQELLARKRELDKQIEEVRKRESAEALASIREMIATFGFTAQQVFPFQPAPRKKAPARYYDPKTGKSWSGRGKVPKWLEGVDRSQYEIRATRTPSQPVDTNNPFPIQ